MFLWPFEIGRSAGLKVLHWLGQEHANYAMGLFAPEAAALTADDLTRLLGAVAHHTGAAAAILKAQPFDWDGSPNPFAKLRWRLAPSRGYAVTPRRFRDALREAVQQALAARARPQGDEARRRWVPHLWLGRDAR